MYDELVKRLREIHPEEFGDAWDFAFACQRAMHEAAAAIEELSKSRWIPVSERLPKEWWPVLGLIKFHGKDEPPAQQVLWYLGNGHWREVWRGDMIENDVTHWMPLPSTEGLNET